jgi:chromate transporter
MSPVREVALLFLRLGLTAFGGPAAHIALMEQATVRERKWLSREEFVDLLGAASLIPGPTSTELSIFLGLRRAGPAGLFAGGIAFILPSVLATLAFAWAYVRFGTVPALAAALTGLQPAVVGVVLAALLPLSRTALRAPFPAALAVLCCAAGLLGAPPLAVLIAAGLAGAAEGTLLAVPLPALAFVFLKIGSILYGSGYLLLSLVRAELVTSRGWLTEKQLLDAVGAGQFTPGPVSSTATFIGYLLAGVPGAAVATVAIFLPSFALVAIAGALLDRMRSSPPLAAFLRGVNAASLGLVAAVVVQLGRAALVSVPSWIVAVLAFALAASGRVNPSLLLVAGAAAGIVVGR